MPRQVIVDGRKLTVPDDATPEEIDEILGNQPGSTTSAPSPSLPPGNSVSTREYLPEVVDSAKNTLMRLGQGAGRLAARASGADSGAFSEENTRRFMEEHKSPDTFAGTTGQMIGSAVPAAALAPVSPAGLLPSLAFDAATGGAMGAMETPDDAISGAVGGAAMGMGGNLLGRGLMKMGNRQIKAADRAGVHLLNPNGTPQAVEAAEKAVPYLQSEELLSANPIRNSTEEVLSRARAKKEGKQKELNRLFEEKKAAGVKFDLEPQQAGLKERIGETKIPGTDKPFKSTSREANELNKQLNESRRVARLSREAAIADKQPGFQHNNTNNYQADTVNLAHQMMIDELRRGSKPVSTKFGTEVVTSADGSRVVVYVDPKTRAPMAGAIIEPDGTVMHVASIKKNSMAAGRVMKTLQAEPGIKAPPDQLMSPDSIKYTVPRGQVDPVQARAYRQSLDQNKYKGTVATRSTAAGTEAERASAAELRRVINEQGGPELANANEGFHNLANIEEMLSTKLAREKTQKDPALVRGVASALRTMSPWQGVALPGAQAALTSTRSSALSAQTRRALGNMLRSGKTKEAIQFLVRLRQANNASNPINEEE
jgi:hypothetical protein